MTLTTEQLSAVETTKEFRALLKYMRAIAKAEPESVKEKLELEEGLWRYASQKAIKAIVGHIDALEFALAANREAQPVAWASTASLKRGDVREVWPNGEQHKAGKLSITALYTAPPAPAVPGNLAAAVNRLLDCDGTRGHFSAIRCSDTREEVERLLAQPVSGGYKLPDGWIACSEQMPELDKRVLLYFGSYGGHIEDGCIGDDGDGTYHYFFDGDSLQQEPTHWMPLPEAPEGGN